MTQVTVKILGDKVEATLEGTLWDQGEQYFVVSTSSSEYRVKESDIIGEIPKAKRIDSNSPGESNTASEGDKYIMGRLRCPSCHENKDVESEFEGTVKCGQCGNELDIRKWKTNTPNANFRYEFR